MIVDDMTTFYLIASTIFSAIFNLFIHLFHRYEVVKRKKQASMKEQSLS